LGHLARDSSVRQATAPTARKRVVERDVWHSDCSSPGARKRVLLRRKSCGRFSDADVAVVMSGLPAGQLIRARRKGEMARIRAEIAKTVAAAASAGV
jgi:hypothetical protein